MMYLTHRTTIFEGLGASYPTLHHYLPAVLAINRTWHGSALCDG